MKFGYAFKKIIAVLLEMKTGGGECLFYIPRSGICRSYYIQQHRQQTYYISNGLHWKVQRYKQQSKCSNRKPKEWLKFKGKMNFYRRALFHYKFLRAAFFVF